MQKSLLIICTMDYIKLHLTGERALFKTDNANIEECLFDDGESPLKESKNFHVNKTTFGWKYPLWYSHDFDVKESTFLEMGRAGVWYSYHFKITKSEYGAPKGIRMCHDFAIEDTCFPLGEETMWWNHDFVLSRVKAKGNYFAMRCQNATVDHLELEGNYAFDSCKNVVISDSVLMTKDAFWNCENVTIKNCVIRGEYFGWNSKNITLINCKISSHQGFCYMENVTLIDCDLTDTDLSFEYCSNIDAKINSRVVSIKNPISGKIVCQGVDELILDDDEVNHDDTEIVVL